MKAFLASLFAALFTLPAAAQVFTVTPEGVDAKYIEFKPTNVTFSNVPLTHHDREDLLRFLQSEQGFTMRPLPVATLTLPANGEMKPSGYDYVNLVQSKGMAAKAGERVTITDVTIEKNSILIDFNGGPVHKHKWLRHISVGMDPNATTPIVADAPNEATGSRIALIFPHDVPDLTGMQVEDLMKPIVDFAVKTPQEAYTDTLPPFLRKAVNDHHVLVGMNHEMVVSAMGQPKTKMREEENQMNIEIWIYGDPPEPTQFVRFNGNRVIRLEIARVGEPIEVHATNEMGDYWNSQKPDNVRIVKLGDQNPADEAKQTARAAPTLRNPGETPPPDKNAATVPQMQPVELPKDIPASQPASSQTGTAQAGTAQTGTAQTGTATTGTTQTAPAQTTPAPPSTPNQNQLIAVSARLL
jgi:hypothetical protein